VGCAVLADAEVGEMRGDVKLSFLVNCRYAFIDPDFEEKGVGGSEAALILLARELARRGHEVEVYGTSTADGAFNGVRYRNIARFDPVAERDVVILFRCAHEAFRAAKAKKKLFWSTDIDWADWEERVFPFADQVIVLSRFHQRFVLETYGRLEPQRVSVMELGVVPEEYFDRPPGELPSKPGNRLIYCSVPERGLAHLARLFPRIKERVPDAELVITSDYSLWGQPPGIEKFGPMFAGIAGVTLFGKVPRSRLVELQKSARVMAYPCTYHEGFCLAAIECIAGGAIPVTTKRWALTTTVGESGVLIDGQPGDEEYDQRFVDAVVGLLRDRARWEELATKGRERVLAQYTWQAVAERFEQIVAGVVPRTQTQAGPELSPTPRRGDGSICTVIPIFNQAKYLFRATASVVWQMRPRDELIVVDDASPDLAQAQGPSQFRDKVMWLRNEVRRGVSFSRNRAIRRSRAEWIKFLDADDVLAPYALDALRNALGELPPAVQVVTGGCHRIVNGRYHDYLSGATQSLKCILRANPILASATFVRREALLEVGLFDERIEFEEDWDLWLKLHERHGLRGFAVTNQPICYYWIHQVERGRKARTCTVEGVPVREYFRQRYHAEPAG